MKKIIQYINLHVDIFRPTLLAAWLTVGFYITLKLQGKA